MALAICSASAGSGLVTTTSKISVEFTDAAETLAAALVSRDEFEIFKAVSALEKRDRDAIASIFNELIIIIRDACVISSGATGTLISRADKKHAQNRPSKYFCQTVRSF